MVYMYVHTWWLVCDEQHVQQRYHVIIFVAVPVQYVIPSQKAISLLLPALKQNYLL